jgi:hypothetical protein
VDDVYNNNNNCGGEIGHDRLFTGNLLPRSNLIANAAYHLMHGGVLDVASDKPLNLETTFRRRAPSVDGRRSRSSNSIGSSCHEPAKARDIEGRWSPIVTLQVKSDNIAMEAIFV